MNTESENLDPLRQKPDFRILSNNFYYEHHDEDSAVIVQMAMEHVWNAHVEPLMKEANQLMSDQDILAKELKDALEDRDKFAIGFLEWVSLKDLKKQHWTAEELLAEYKESLLNQKP